MLHLTGIFFFLNTKFFTSIIYYIKKLKGIQAEKESKFFLMSDNNLHVSNLKNK